MLNVDLYHSFRYTGGQRTAYSNAGWRRPSRSGPDATSLTPRVPASAIAHNVQARAKRQEKLLPRPALRDSSPMGDAARAVWQKAHIIEIKHETPEWSAAGKVLPIWVRARKGRTADH